MKQQFTVNEGNRDLILIFAGWGMDAGVWHDLRVEGHDIMIVWDYRNPDFDETELARYRDIRVFAWSFGVFVAALTIPRFSRRPGLSIAINGTLTPVNALTGIPEAIFEGTLAGLDERNLLKFYRRMCSSKEQYAGFLTRKPDRDIAELRDELTAIRNLSSGNPPLHTAWDRVILSQDDHIFPPENMKRAWEGHPRSRITDGGHLPDFPRIIEQEIIDKKLVTRKFARSAATYSDAASAQRTIAVNLWERWQAHSPGIPLTILEIGYGTGFLTRCYIDTWHPYRITLWDLAPVPIELPAAGEIIAGDAEQLIDMIADDSYEAIVSASTIQWFNNLPRFMNTALHKLKPGGIMAISTFAPGNMRELASVTRLPLRYYTQDELRAMLPPDCSILEMDEEDVVTKFATPRDVLLNLRATGVNAVRHASVSPADIDARYPREADGSCRLTYRALYMIIKRNSDE